MEKNLFSSGAIPGFTQILLKMKLTVFLLMITVLSVMAIGSYSQSTMLTVEMKNSTLAEVLEAIEGQSEFRFFYSSNVKLDKSVSVNQKEKKVFQILDEVLDGTGIDYEVYGRQIALLAKGETSSEVLQQKKVTGKVTDTSDATMPGVSVVLKGTSTGTITDIDGNYTLNGTDGQSVIVFTFIGMKKKEVPVGNQQVIDVQLESETIGLEEVVAIGYGVVKKENLTGAVATVSNEELANRPINSMSEALNGIVSNLQITTKAGGQPGAESKFQLRGVGSISGFASSEPLVMVDGVESDLSFVNPQDIESISILKDAAASSIFGSKAPYGVILIKTKEGKKGKPIINLSVNSSLRSPRNVYKRMGTLDHFDYWRRVEMNDDGKITYHTDDWYEAVKAKIDDPSLPDVLVDEKDSTMWGRKVATDVDGFHEIYKQSSATKDYNVSISGANEKSSYYFSGGFLDQDGQLKLGEDYYKRYSFLGKFKSKVTDWLEFDYRIQYALEDIKQAPADKPIFYSFVLAPNTPFYDPNGNILNQEIQWLKEDAMKYLTKNDNFNNTFNAILTPFEGLKIQSAFSYILSSTDKTFYQNPVARYSAQNKFTNYSGTSELKKWKDQNRYYSVNIFGDYIKSIGDNNFYLLIGYQQEYNRISNMFMSRNDRVENNILSINSATGDVFDFGDYDAIWATRGFFGRFTYNYKEKYLFEFNSRYDGSSRFSKQNRWGFFPSASVAYTISKESFFEPLSNTVSFLKFRTSYGMLGNTNLTRNNIYYQASMGKGTTGWLSPDGSSMYETMNAPKIGSEHLTWEKPSTFDVGLDMTLFDNKLQVVFDWYRRITRDMVGPTPPVASVVGLTKQEKPLVNNTEMKSIGFETDITYKDQIGQVKFMVGAGISSHKETITKYYNPKGGFSDLWSYSSGSTYFYEGMVLGEIWGYETVGFINDEATRDEINKQDAGTHSQKNIYSGTWNLGDIVYADLNGDGKITQGKRTLDDHGDLRIIGNETPAFDYNIKGSLNWKGFDARILFTGCGSAQWYPRRIEGQDVWYNHWIRRQFFGTTQGSDYVALEMHKDNYWTPDNRNAYFPNAYVSDDQSAYRNTEPQTKYLQNKAYLRLKNLQVGYSFPSEIVNKLKLGQVRFYLSGENLFTITKMLIYDPELPGQVYPFSKVYSAGLTVQF